MESLNEKICPGFDSSFNNDIQINLDFTHNPETVLVNLIGYIDTYNSNYVLEQLNKLNNTSFKNIIVNCEKLSYVSSTGLGGFIMLQKGLLKKNKNLYLYSLTEKIKDTFDLMGFSKYFNIEDSLDKCFSSILNRETEVENINVKDFPKVMECEYCKKKYKINRPGKFRCPHCKEIVTIV